MDEVSPITATINVIVSVVQTDYRKEITGYTALDKVTLDEDKGLATLDDLKASGKLPVQATLAAGADTTLADITNWMGDFDGTSTTEQTLTAVWTVSAGYKDGIDPITVEAVVDVAVAQTHPDPAGMKPIHSR